MTRDHAGSGALSSTPRVGLSQGTTQAPGHARWHARSDDTLRRSRTTASCVACHQPTGMGLPPVFPPLTKSEYVNGSAERLIAMVLKGNAGPMTIEGKPYNNIMPGQELVLKDEQIAAVLSFVRQNFGNNAPAIRPEMVAAARKKFAERKAPWTEPELKAWKEDAPATATAAPAPKSGS